MTEVGKFYHYISDCVNRHVEKLIFGYDIIAHWTYSMDDNGTPSDDKDIVVYYRYTDYDWPDQLTKYNGHIITYDNLGNPTEYHNGLKFE